MKKWKLIAIAVLTAAMAVGCRDASKVSSTNPGGGIGEDLGDTEASAVDGMISLINEAEENDETSPDPAGEVLFGDIAQAQQRSFLPSISLIESAYAADGDCEVRLRKSACNADGANSFQEIYRLGCLIPGTLVAVTGPAKLSYNNANCSLANNGDVATRTHNLTFTRNGNGEVRSVSDASANYQGLVVGGGQELEKTAAGWDLAILGKRITIDVYRRPGIQADLSIRTGQPLAISGTLRRLNRLVSSGSIIVDHNRARFSANFQPQNLQWNSAACNCPVSGTVRVDYSGSINSGGEVEFTSCGSAILRKDNGTERVLALKSCLVPNAI